MKISEKIQATKPITWWLTGLSGAGKSTLARAMGDYLRQHNQAVCILDGDDLRKGLSKDLHFSVIDREEQCRRAAEVAHLLNKNGIFAIVALISPTQQGRAKAREIIGSDAMKEVYVSTPLEVCKQRDVKGLYARAQQDASMNLTGVQAPYEQPINPDFKFNTAHITVDDALQQLFSPTSLN